MANTVEYFKPSEGVIFKSTNSQLKGTEAKFETMSKKEYKEAYKQEENSMETDV